MTSIESHHDVNDSGNDSGNDSARSIQDNPPISDEACNTDDSLGDPDCDHPFNDSLAFRIFRESMSFPGNARICLLTPSPTSRSTPSTSIMPLRDPFEMLGRELSQLVGFVRHIPYDPDVGNLTLQEPYLQECTIAICVTCQDTRNPQPLWSQETAPVTKQVQFAKHVIQFMEYRKVGHPATVMVMNFGDGFPTIARFMTTDDILVLNYDVYNTFAMQQMAVLFSQVAHGPLTSELTRDNKVVLSSLFGDLTSDSSSDDS